MATPSQLSLYGTMTRPLAGGISLAVASGFFPDKWMPGYSGVWTLGWFFLGSAILFAFLSIVSSVFMYGLFFSKGRKEFRPQQVFSVPSVWVKTAVDLVVCVLLFGSLLLIELLVSAFFANRTFDDARIFVTLPILMTAWVAANVAIRFTVKLLLSRSHMEPQK